MKYIYKYGSIAFSLGFALLINPTIYAESEGDTSSLLERIAEINQNIRQMSKSQSKNYKSAVKSMGKSALRYQEYAAIVNNLNTQFRGVLAQYKPKIVSWADFDPIEFYDIDKNDIESLSAFIDEINEIKGDLQSVRTEMKNLVQEIESDNTSYTSPRLKTTRTIYRYSSPRVYSSPSYRYIYPRQSYYRYPYSYGYDSYYYPYYSYPRFGINTGFFSLFL
jgi:hypothetical protein